MTKNSQRQVWLQAAVVLLIVAALVAWFVWSETKPLNHVELKIPIADLRTYCAAAVLQADLTLHGKTTQSFYESQLIMLREKVSADMKALDSAKVESGLEIKHWQARRLVRELQTSLDQLQSSFAQPKQIEAVKTDLENLLPRLKELEATL